MTATETTTPATTSTDKSDPASRLSGARAIMGNYGIPVGPARHLATERERLLSLTWSSFTARPVSATVGAEISDIDLTAHLSDDTIDEIQRALDEYKVLFFRDQPLTAAQHVAFASRFGELEIHPFLAESGDDPHLVRFTKSAETGGYENMWHHDVTWRECPSKAAILHALDVPPVGGDTLFLDMCAAYDSLDDETKDLIEGRSAIHDFLQAFGAGIAPERMEEMRATYPTVEHPLVVTHERTGRKLLYVNRVFVTGIVGMEPQEGYALIDRLCRLAEVPEHQVRLKWERDSIAFWDNRAVQHYASSDYWPATRVMERASIIGSRPRA